MRHHAQHTPKACPQPCLASHHGRSGCHARRFASLAPALPPTLAKTLCACLLLAGLAFNPCAVPAAHAANSGGQVVPDYRGPGDDAYIGNYQPGGAEAAGGRVSIDSGFDGDVVGGYVYSGNGNTQGNTVFMSGGNTKGIKGGYVRYGDGDAVGNRVVISGGWADGQVVGGQSTRGDGSAIGNSVFISGGIVNSAEGGRGQINAEGNSVVVTGGTVLYVVTGGYSDSASGGDAINNSVVISGGTIGAATSGYIAGGHSFYGNAQGNSVTLRGNPTLDADMFINGGLANAYGTGTGTSSNNTLNVFTQGLRVDNINWNDNPAIHAAANTIQNYNFALPHAGRTGLTLTGAIGGATDFGVLGTDELGTVAVPWALPGSARQVGDSITLLTNTSGSGLTGTNNLALPAGTAKQGLFFTYDYTLSADANSIKATITDVQYDGRPGAALTESRAASLAFANLGADLVAGAGLDNAKAATAATAKAATGAAAGSPSGVSGGSASGPASSMGLVPFFALSGSSLRYNTGSHVDVNGVALMAGLAKKWQGPATDVLAGAFFEAAFGSYKSHNSIAGMGSVNGKGDTRTLGGGILARLDVTDTALKGLYAEASVRMGSLTNDYRSGDLRDPFTGNTAKYDSNSTYYGAHAGLGYVWSFTANASLDVYAKYFWTHQQGQDVTILDERFNFKATDSHRTRVGARFAYAVTEQITPYIGAAWEHEFGGKARATLYGFDVPAPSLKGSTGLGELGLTWKPAQGSALSVDFGVTGYVGKREGVSGNVQLKFEF